MVTKYTIEPHCIILIIMKYMSLINSLLTLFLSDEVTSNLVMDKKNNIEIVNA